MIQDAQARLLLTTEKHNYNSTYLDCGLLLDTAQQSRCAIEMDSPIVEGLRRGIDYLIMG